MHNVTYLAKQLNCQSQQNYIIHVQIDKEWNILGQARISTRAIFMFSHHCNPTDSTTFSF